MISIIVPIYNAEAYLAACIESVLAQTEKGWQLLLVDDGSTDGSRRIAQAYAAKDDRITVLPEAHAGQSAARNKGMEKAEGEYIAFLDADDALESDWCAKHLAAIEGVDYVQSGYKRVQPSAVSSPKCPKHRWQFTSPCMRLYRRKAIEGLQFAEGLIYEDVLFSADLWLSQASCRIIPYAGYLYTLNPTSTTSQSHPQARQNLFHALRTKVRKASLWGKIIICYTLTRLHIHFLIQ
jgi:glycosyltransferase involved in cell wall biosynthesis